MNQVQCILIVDDQREILESLQLILEAEGYCVLKASDGAEALDQLQTAPVELIVADIAMPHMNGYQLYQRVRENPAWITIPFVFLTARALDSDIRYGKELGVDDYLTKPIQPEDLLAAVKGKLLRARQLSEAMEQFTRTLPLAPIVIAGALQMDSGQYRAWLGEQPLELSSREFVLLEYLARRPNQVVTPQELIRATHGLETDALEAGSLLRPLIRSLRRKLGYCTGEMGCIVNVRGVGYRLSPPTGQPGEVIFTEPEARPQ
jgi:DNA-binding response OmpR family regulator